VFPKGGKWIHDMIYDKPRRDVDIAQRTLEQNFHDIATIWYHGGPSIGIHERYVCIYKTRALWNEPGHVQT